MQHGWVEDSLGHHNEQLSCGAMGWKEKLNSSCAVEGGRNGNRMAVKNRLMGGGLHCHLGPRNMCGPVLLPRAMSGILALLQPGSVLMSVACVTSKAMWKAHGLDCCGKPC